MRPSRVMPTRSTWRLSPGAPQVDQPDRGRATPAGHLGDQRIEEAQRSVSTECVRRRAAMSTTAEVWRTSVSRAAGSREPGAAGEGEVMQRSEDQGGLSPPRGADSRARRATSN